MKVTPSKQWMLVLAIAMTAGACVAMPLNGRAASFESPQGSESGAVPQPGLEGSASPKRTKMLQISIEHAEQLAPLDDRLQVGNTFDKKVFPAREEENKWAKIPAWLAGTWHTENISEGNAPEF